MIDPLSAPGMGVDIRLSTLEPVQQLGSRLAQVLSGELSRLRADAAFATASGIAVHAPAAQAETLYAQQSSALGYHQLGLSLRPASFGASTDTVGRDAETERRRNAAEQDEKKPFERYENPEQESERGQTQEHDEQANQQEPEEQRGHGAEYQEDLSSVHETETIANNPKLASALNAALEQCSRLSSDIGLSGAPVAVALPAKHWINAYSPANLRCQAERAESASEKDNVPDLLVLCLAYDGSLGHSRALFGLLFMADNWVGSLRTEWSSNEPEAGVGQDVCAISVRKPCARISVVSLTHDSGSCVGMRVKIDEMADEPSLWFWNASEWTWH